MYRLSGTKDTIVQKFVTNEIIRGFAYTLGTSDDSNIPNEDDLECFIDYSDVLSKIVSDNPEAQQMLQLKLSSMLSAMKDPAYEYTFDEFGEFLLYELIQYSKSLDDIWEAGGSYFDREVLRHELHAYAEAISEDCMMESAFAAELENNTLDAILFFPHLANELEVDTLFEFLFWDIDFKLFYEYDFDFLEKYMDSDTQMGFCGHEVVKVPILPAAPHAAGDGK